MTEENEKISGGLTPAESDAERRDLRLSADFSSGEPDADAGNEADNDPVSRAPRSREELEKRYRSDPRLNKLFDQGIVKKRNKNVSARRNIKVGGIRLTPKRIVILSGFLFIFLLCLGACLFYAFKDIGTFRDYARASALLESGDYEAAKKLFIKVLNADPNKEGAVVAMADIYHHDGDWSNEAFFRQRIMRLNPLNPDLFHDFLESAFRARNFGVVYSHLNLKLLEKSELSPEDGALYVIAAMQSDHVQNGKAFYTAAKKQNPKFFSSTERGRFVELKMNTVEMDSEREREFLAFLATVQDPQTRFETINTLLYFYSKLGTPESQETMEKLLRESVELNSFAGAPLLANYYFIHYRFDDAIKVCNEYLKMKMNAFMPLLLGESYALSGQTDMIPPLAEMMHNLRGRQSKVLASYLNALTAFCEGDNDRLRTLLLESGTTIETPLSNLMKLQIAIWNDSPKEIIFILRRIMNGRPFMDFQQRARTAALHYLLEKADSAKLSTDPEMLNNCAEIALLIQTPDDNVSFLRRFIMLDLFKRNVLKDEDIQNALNDFPGDIVLLQIAARYYLLSDRPSRAMDFIEEYNALTEIPDKPSIAFLHMVALDRIGRKDDAEKEFRELVEHGDEDGMLLALYFEFCTENKFIDSLKSLSEWIAALPKDSAKHSILPFVQAEILLSEGKKDQALDLFEKSRSPDSRFIFHAAGRLADAGRTDAAIARYRSILNSYSDKVLLNVRLSRLYMEKGDRKSALAFAETAWREDPNDLQARYLYGKCLFEEGKVADAIAALKFPQYRASFPAEMLSLWEKAVRKQIRTDYAGFRYSPAMENAKHLLTYFPDDQEAKDYIDKIEDIRRREKNRGKQK